MSDAFDKPYWDEHWAGRGRAAAVPVNPHLVAETAALSPGSALDAGCGTGTEAIWLAAQGWQVTGADISAEALAVARGRSTGVRWLEADLTTWEPLIPFELVTTHYAHTPLPQLDFYQRIAGWVAPGGTLLIVGHLKHSHHPDEASVSAADIAARLGAGAWRIETAAEYSRDVGVHDVGVHDGRTVTLSAAVVRATRV